MMLRDSTTSRVHRSAPVRRDGFALPLAIVVLTLLTMGLVAGFAVASSEASVTVSQRAQARAYTYAQQGLEVFLTRRKEKTGTQFCPHCWTVNATTAAGSIAANLDTLPTRAETVYVALGATGAAIVRATPITVNVAAGTGTYFITSTGIDLQNAIGGGGGRSSQARRTVGIFANWSKVTMNVVSAWTSLSGIDKNGTGNITGVDQCGSGTNVAGLSVPFNPATNKADLSISGGSFHPGGNPPYDTLSTFAAESTKLKMDWASIINESAITPDIVIPGGTFPSTGTFAADTNYWPIIHVTSAGNFPLPHDGRGMLIVDNDLTISGSDQWSGVILVGGKLTSNGNNTSAGATLSGLNYLLGAHPGPSVTTDDATANGQKSYVYNSCSVAKATGAMARYTIMPNTWMDDIAGW